MRKSSLVMAEYLGSESDLPSDQAVTNSTDETNQNTAEAHPGSNDQNSDMFSELTPLVFYHILSFLGANDLARLCLVSARFRERYMSSPDILFYVDFDEESCTRKCRGLRNLLDKLLDVQAANSGLNLFRLQWRCHECNDFSPTSVFHRWVKRAVIFNAREIDIKFFTGQVDFVLPDCLCGASATILRLNLHDGRLNCQPKDDFDSISVLSLSSMRVQSGCHLGEWISSHFRSLKTLKLEKIRFTGDLSVTSSSLECLTISHCLIGPGPSLYTCAIECTSLESLLIHYCRFNSVKLSITCPSLNDLQITKCSDVTFAYCEISAEALRTLSVDMTFLGPLGRAFEIHPLSLPSLERVVLKLRSKSNDDNDSVRTDIRACVFEFLPILKYPYLLEIDIDTIRILDIEEVEVVLNNLYHLEVSIVNLQEWHATNIATFISVMCWASPRLGTVTITYEECESDLILLHVVGSLKSYVRRDIPSTIKIAWSKRSITVARDEASTCFCATCMLGTGN